MTSSPDAPPAGEESLSGGSYEVIRARLLTQASELAAGAERINDRRKQIFGASELRLLESVKVRTENNSVPRDIVAIGDRLLFGYGVFLGLKSETRVPDVLSLYRFEQKDEEFDLSPLAFTEGDDLLGARDFVKEFADLYRYRKEARLLQLRRTDTRLLAIFQAGPSERDVKVFRWSIDPRGATKYLDARGEEDNVPPRSHNFKWTKTTRDDHVAGKHPHVSIFDEIFIEAVGGDLTVKIENNTESGKGVYVEPVEDPNQSLDDADIQYARVGSLILVRVKPFRETAFRYLVYNPRTESVARVDAIERACLELPENHGIVFPGGFYLETGELKIFDGMAAGMEFERGIRSPNGEDVLFVFHRGGDGAYLLYAYNLIRKEVAAPILCHGYSLYRDGKLLVFRSTSDEPRRDHAMQVWKTPFVSSDFAADVKTDGSYLAKVGNPELVRGISDALTLKKLASAEKPTRRTFEDLLGAAQRMLDAYFWLGHEEAGKLSGVVKEIRKTAEQVLGEFDKAVAVRARAEEALEKARREQQRLLLDVRPEDMKDVSAFMSGLTALRKQRGHLVSLEGLQAIDKAAVARLSEEASAAFDAVSAACVAFLLGEAALEPLFGKLEALLSKVGAASKSTELSPLGAELEEAQEGLGLLAEIAQGLKVDDPTARTKILEKISELYSHLNRVRASLAGRKKDLGSAEGRAEFGAQLALFNQAVVSALGAADTPDRCEAELSRLVIQLEELEGRFGEYPEFSVELAGKRDEVTDAFGQKGQSLRDERQRRADGLAQAAERIAQSIARRAKTFKAEDEQNAYFASDPMVLKLKDLAKDLRALGDSVKGDEVEGRLKSVRQEAQRALRDKRDLFAEDGATIKLGPYRFSVNTQALELSIVPREGGLALHLSGTDFFEPLSDPALESARDLWEQSLVSESPEVYRSEYLAASILASAEAGANDLSLTALHDASRAPGGLLELVRAFSSARHDEGYERGVHDADAARLLDKLLTLRESAGLLRFGAKERSAAVLAWAAMPEEARAVFHRRCRSIGRLSGALGHAQALPPLAAELAEALLPLAAELGLPLSPSEARAAARYLALELSAERPRFVVSEEAVSLKDALLRRLSEEGGKSALEDDLRGLEGQRRERLALALAWIEGFVASSGAGASASRCLEAASLLALPRGVGGVDREPSAAITSAAVSDLLGQHPRVRDGKLEIALDEFLARLSAFSEERVPRFRAYRKARQAVVERERARLRLGEFAPKVLTSFVRNRLIDEVYLPLVGQNLAKQLGAAGEAKRTDLMGMLLVISPPGYGKTTLMEYVASRLGLTFVKVNGPSLGHEVVSLDPADAPNATARQEVDKVNLALEMGSNVMLYLDDIQHTNPEFLQKFISLCDGQRRIEGVWKGKTRTYDLRGKKFCVVMAGNPYTESGETFRIPDMLANRADTYNLGEVLGGKEDLFALSYVENSLTSNPSLAPLAGREPADVHKLIRMAQGEPLPLTDLAHGYSALEVSEVTAVLSRLFQAQKVLLAVNQEYIASASKADAFRTEPPFKLQGSYRNMNKIAEKLTSAHTPEEVERLLDDHYAGESQTLTTGAEQSLLKLAELRGRMTDTQKARWEEIKKAYARSQAMGGKESDPASRVTGALLSLETELSAIRRAIDVASQASAARATQASPAQGGADLARALEKLEASLKTLGRPELSVRVEGDKSIAGLLAEQLGMLERALIPLARAASAAAMPSAASPAGAPTRGDKIDEIETLLRSIDEKMNVGPARPSAPPFEASMGPNGASGFYKKLTGDDAVEQGGVFVATYRKLPKIGDLVTIRLVFPQGDLEVQGQVEWTREAEFGDERPPGFGAKLIGLSPEEARILRAQSRTREPMLHD